MQETQQILSWFGVSWRDITVAVVSFVAAHLWSRYQNRLATVRWSAKHIPMASAGENPRFGRIGVTWNDQPVRHVQFCSVEVENESSRDFENVALKFVYSDGSRFLGFEGMLTGTSQYLPWTPRFHETAQRFVGAGEAATQADHDYLDTHREFVVPVFNRGTKFEVTFLIHPPDGQSPYIEVFCDHAGVRTVQRGRLDLFLGVPRKQAEAWGLATGVVLVYAIGQNVGSWWLGLALVFLAGVGVTSIGAGVVRTGRWVRRRLVG